MQFSVPQFIEVEDKIIGPLTLKQFLILLGGGLLCFLYWSILKVNLILFLFSLPTMGLAAMLAFGKFNGRPALANIRGFINFFSTPKVRIFQRTGEKDLMLTKKIVTKKEAAAEADHERARSRLKKLAYVLDQKTAEEERLIHSGEMQKKWLNQI